MAQPDRCVDRHRRKDLELTPYGSFSTLMASSDLNMGQPMIYCHANQGCCEIVLALSVGHSVTSKSRKREMGRIILELRGEACLQGEAQGELQSNAAARGRAKGIAG